MAFDPDAYLAKQEKKKGFDPDAYLAKTKPETALQTFGRSAASIPDTALNLITGALDVAAYPLARAYYGMTGNRTPEEAAALAQQQTTSPKDVIGRALGVAGTPGYENAPQRQLANYLGQTFNEGIINPLAETTGLPAQDIGSMVNTAGIAVPGMAKGGYTAVKPALQATKDVVGGAVGRGTGYIAEPSVKPKGYQVESSRAKLRNTVMLPEDVAKFERGEMPYGQLPTEVPISQLPRNTTEKLALQLSGGDIPYQGQAARAFGERIGETYRNPITAAIDIGSMFATGGIPLVSTARAGLAGVQGIADSILARRGLDPNLPTRLADYQSGARPMPGAPGPVAPADIMSVRQARRPLQPNPQLRLPAPPMYVAPEGVAGTNINQVSQAGAQQKYAPQPVQQTPQQMAVQKTQEIVNQQKTISPQQQAILDQIRARGNKAPVPTQPAPVAGPVKPTSIETSIDALPSDRFSAADKLALKKAELQNNPPAPMTAVEEVTARADMAKQQKAMTPEYRGTIVKEWIKGNQLVEGVPIDTSKKAYNGSNLVRANAQKLMKAQIDSIPVIEGVTPAQTINAMVAHLEKTNPGIFKAKKKGPSNVSKMLTGEDLPSGISSLSKELTGKIYSSKAEYDKANLFNTLQENIPRASYMEGDKLITVYPQNIPADLMKVAGIEKMARVVRDAKTGKVIGD